MARNMERLGEATAFRFLLEGDVEGPTETLSFAELDARATAVARLLADRRLSGERVLLLYAPGLDFVVGFLGCLRAGAVAVPAYPPDLMRLERTLPRLQAIARDCGARGILTQSFIAAAAGELLASAPELTSLPWLATDGLAPATDPLPLRHIAADEVAFLQYTSGSTSQPKGVRVTHGNLLHNSRAIARIGRAGPDSVAVNWLPSYHDMGLIGGILQPLFTGFPAVLMSPLAFLRQPLRWLKAISHFGGTDTAFPNFALDLCVRKSTDEELETLRLHTWRMAWNGAEPVRPASMERFAARFAPCGFRREAFLPVYGLAEGTLIVSGERERPQLVIRTADRDALARHEVRPATDDRPLQFVGCGRAIDGEEIVIADPHTCRRAAPDTVGEIWLRGPSVAHGYFGREELTRDVFGAHLADGTGPFLRTGDLGFLQDGQLFVTGRLKDLIVIRGENYYPQDIEAVVERAHPAIRVGSVAAVALDEDAGEQLAVVIEVKDGLSVLEREDLLGRVREAVAAEVTLSPGKVALVQPGTLPKTSSGKLQRYACRDGLVNGTLDLVWLEERRSVRGGRAA